MIELVMVIVIIGILSSAALPRFANLTGQAQTTSNQGVAGNLRSAVGIAHTAWFAAGGTSSVNTVTLDTGGLSINDNGWPDGGTNGTTLSATAATAQAACIAVLSNLLNSPPQAVATTGCTDNPCYIVPTSVAGTSVCTYNLNGSATRNITYNISTGLVTAN